jgi:phenylalanyl-tRNA synthetase beta chain
VVGQDVAAAKVLEIVNNAAGKHLKSLELFDIYTGERVEINTKSFAFSLTFQSESSSLTSADIDAVTNNIIMALQDSVGAELRT